MNLKYPYVFKYDTSEYRFRESMFEIFSTNNLEKIDDEKIDVLRAADTDQSTYFHKLFYEKFKLMNPIYLNFLKNIIQEGFGFDEKTLVYQKIPTFRIHLPNNLGVGEFHKDSKYNHSSYELNIWVPFVDTFDTNTIWIHSNGENKPPVAYNVKYGEALVFNGADNMHGNFINKTGITRTSMDFRICNINEFVPVDKKTLNTKLEMNIGGYFSIM